MEHIIGAVSRAKEAQKDGRTKAKKPDRDPVLIRPHSQALTPGGNTLSDCPDATLDPEHLESQRIVAYQATDPSHIAFNVLRTKLYQTLTANSWKSFAITSPNRDCGKTMVSINLAFSMSRQKNCRTVLIDLDLQKSSVANALGIIPQKSIGQYLEGTASLEECFVKLNENFFVGLNLCTSNKVFEVAQHSKATEIIPKVVQELNPQVVIMDLPPILSNDDVIASLPLVDAAVLVAAAGATTAEEIEECKLELDGKTTFLGVILNKCADLQEDYYT